MIPILLRNLEAHALTVWKKSWMLMKLKIGWGAPYVSNGFIKRALNSDFLTN